MDSKHRNVKQALRKVFDYHQATKHQFQAYANGPGYLDWATQPDPFRRYADVPLIELKKIPPTATPCYDAMYVPHGISTCATLNLHSVSQLFYDSLALSAWKIAGDTQWALRVNASSGNLHPTEAYLICGSITGLTETAMVSHYTAKQHSLEVLATLSSELWHQLRAQCPPHTLFIGFTSIHWREAWKYGERAYRYCQHDVGHAIGALGIAAAGLGWQANLLDDLSTEELALLLGTFRQRGAEADAPDVLIALSPITTPTNVTRLPSSAIQSFEHLPWQGQPKPLSPAHVDWGMEEIAKATQKPNSAIHHSPFTNPFAPYQGTIQPVSLRKIIRQRRSAVAMDGETSICKAQFYAMLQKTLATPSSVPFASLPWKSKIHLAIFVHRVDDLAPGLYLLVRDPAQKQALQSALTQADTWQRPAGCPPSLELYCLLERDARAAARQISCHQDIASDGCFSLAMIAEYQSALEQYGAWFYSHLYWEAGLIGQVLYLEAEAAGVRSTGIGCFFDDAMHEVLGITDRAFQDIYHFTVGGAIDDTRITTAPAYPDECAT